MLQIHSEQMQKLSDAAFYKTERDIAQALRKNYSIQKNIPLAIDMKTISCFELEQFVHQNVEIGKRYGFETRGDFYSLVEICVLYGANNVLSMAILEHDQLSPSHKIKVMVDFYTNNLFP